MSTGACPMIFLENIGTNSGFANIPAASTGLPRNIAGFENLKLRLADETTPIFIDNVANLQEEGANLLINIYPNPTTGIIHINSSSNKINDLSVYSSEGKLLEHFDAINKKRLDLSDLDPGIYLLKISCFEINKSRSYKFIISK